MPDEGQGARLLPQELETVRQHHRQTTNSSSRMLAALLADRDALAAENQRLRSAAQMALDLEEWRYSAPTDEVMREIRDRAQHTVDTLRTALAERADGEA